MPFRKKAIFYFKWLILAAGFVLAIFLFQKNYAPENFPKKENVDSIGIFWEENQNNKESADEIPGAETSEKIPSIKINYFSAENPDESFGDSIPNEIVSSGNTKKPEPLFSEKIAVLKFFGNEMGKILKPISEKMSSDGQVFEKAWQTPDQNTFKSLEEIGERFIIAGERLFSVKPPSGTEDILKNLSSSYKTLGESAKNLPKNLKDGKITGEAWQNYGEKAVLANKAFVAVMDYFKNNGVKFEPNEDGYMFMYEMAY